MGIGPEYCEECGNKIPHQPKPIKDKYGGKSLCAKCKIEYRKEHNMEEDGG